LQSAPQPAVAVLLGVWGLIGTPAPVAWGLWLSKTVPRDAEAGGGLMVATIQMAITIGSAAGGALFDAVGWWSPFALGVAALLGSAVLALATFRASLMFAIKEPEVPAQTLDLLVEAVAGNPCATGPGVVTPSCGDAGSDGCSTGNEGECHVGAALSPPSPDRAAAPESAAGAACGKAGEGGAAGAQFIVLVADARTAGDCNGSSVQTPADSPAVNAAALSFSAESSAGDVPLSGWLPPRPSCRIPPLCPPRVWKAHPALNSYPTDTAVR
jgi:MFS family permease